MSNLLSFVMISMGLHEGTCCDRLGVMAVHPTENRSGKGGCVLRGQVPRTRLQVSSVSEVKTSEQKAGSPGSNGAAGKAPEYYEVPAAVLNAWPAQ